MNRELETRLIKRCIANKQHRTTSLGTQQQQSSLTKYTDPHRFQAEYEGLFKALPQPLVHHSVLKTAHSYQTVDTALGSLIVMRDEQGRARVFRNSCRHRGAKLVEGSGCNKRLICPYHAWSYASNGQLLGVPGQAHCFPDLNKTSHGLVELASIEKYGFIWLCPQLEQDEISDVYLDNHLGEMSAHLGWMQAESLKVYQRSTKSWQGNWKVFVEGGLETYHFACAHKHTIASSFQNNIAVIDQLGAHFRVVMPTKAIDQEGLLEQQCLSLRDYSHTLFLLTPNSAMLIQEQHLDWIQFRPLSVNETEIVITTLIPTDQDLTQPAIQQHWQKNHHITLATLEEDWRLGEGIQASAASGSLPYIQYGKNEWALQAFNAFIDEKVTIMMGA